MDYPAKLDWKDTYHMARLDAARRGYAGAEMCSGAARAFVDRTRPKAESVLAYRVGAYQTDSAFLTRAEQFRALSAAAKARRTLASMAADCLARGRIIADAKRALAAARIAR